MGLKLLHINNKLNGSDLGNPMVKYTLNFTDTIKHMFTSFNNIYHLYHFAYYE